MSDQRYTVSQTLETLGEPICKLYPNLAEALLAARVLRDKLVQMILGHGWMTDGGYVSRYSIGSACEECMSEYERSAWAEAHALAGRYGANAGAVNLATMAVLVTPEDEAVTS